MNMPTQEYAIRQDRVIEDMAVVSDVSVRHQEITVAQPSHAVFLVGTTVDRDPFAKKIVVTDFNACRTTLVTEVLWFAANDGAGEEAISLTDRRVAGDDDVAMQHTAIAQFDMGTDEAEGTYFHVTPQLCFGINMGEWRNEA
jgi:hypothetical protein